MPYGQLAIWARTLRRFSSTEQDVAGASANGEVNHWPAFVDVLTTVIMVVTFLLVIMSAAVVQLSQRVIANFKQQMVQQQQQARKSARMASPVPTVACAPGATAVISPREAEAGTSVGRAWRGPAFAHRDRRGRAPDDPHARHGRDTLQLQVKAIEKPDDSKGVEVKTATPCSRLPSRPMPRPTMKPIRSG